MVPPRPAARYPPPHPAQSRSAQRHRPAGHRPEGSSGFLPPRPSAPRSSASCRQDRIAPPRRCPRHPRQAPPDRPAPERIPYDRRTFQRPAPRAAHPASASPCREKPALPFARSGLGWHRPTGATGSGCHRRCRVQAAPRRPAPRCAQWFADQEESRASPRPAPVRSAPQAGTLPTPIGTGRPRQGQAGRPEPRPSPHPGRRRPRQALRPAASRGQAPQPRSADRRCRPP